MLRPHNKEGRSGLRHCAKYFPHIKFDRLRLGDVIRIPLQLLWLALVRTTPKPIFPLPLWKQQDWHWLARLRRWLTGNATAKIKLRTDQLRVRIRPAVEHFRQIGEEQAKHRCWDYPVTRYLACGASVLLAFLCITMPLDALDQLKFAALLVVIAWIARLVSGQFITLFLVGLSIIASSRYFWWRASATLNLDENIGFAWGLVLIAAEFYAWLVLLADYWEVGWADKRSTVELLIPSGQPPSEKSLLRTGNELINGIARAVFLTAPLAFLLFDAYIIYAPPILLVLYVLPHMAHAIFANSRNQGGGRLSFLALVSETILSWCAARHIIAMLFDFRKKTSSAAGNSAEKEYSGQNVLTPLIFLIGLNLIGFIAGLNRWYLNPHDEVGTILLNLVWALYNLLFLGAAITIILEFKKIGTDDLPKYGWRGTLTVCLMGYSYLGKSLLLCFSPVARRLSRVGMVVGTYLPRSPELSPE